MSDIIATYRSGKQPIPDTIKRWHLKGAGLDALSEETVKLPAFGADEVLVRHDTCGICFSDIKIINLGADHPRLQGRDMQNNPVVMGHEVALTIVGIGENLTNRFQIGDRFIVQADVYYKGVNVAYGYQLDGGFAQYGVVTKEVLEGDEGCYLIPIKDDTGYVEAALVEPWACVVAAYDFNNYRDGLLDNGKLLIVDAGKDADAILSRLSKPGRTPSSITKVAAIEDFAELRKSKTNGDGFDDIVIAGDVDGETISKIATALGKRGVLLLVSDKVSIGKSPIDAGRIHYEQQLYVGAKDIDSVADTYTSNTRKEIKPGGSVWFIGAGGPMGQMHLQRAVMLPEPPKRVVVTDTLDDRLNRIEARFGKLMTERGIELIKLNPTKGDNPADFGPYDDIVCLVPIPAVISDTMSLLAENGVYNIFAGVAKGVMANLDLGEILSKNQRMVGTSGSTISDLLKTLDLVESDLLSTNASLAAIGGMDVFREGLAAVKAGEFPGKTVIFPQIEDLPLTSIDQMKERMPSVYAKLQDGIFWTNEAEEELLKEYLKK